jgi:hypothetical protein
MVRYRKNKGTTLFADLERVLGVSKAQNYNPTYNRFFKLNATNWNNVVLEVPCEIKSVEAADEIVVQLGAEEKKLPCFFKYSPLLEPNRFMSGGYDEKTCYALPVFGSIGDEKLDHLNNSSYVDAFFCYLSGTLREKGFQHGLEYYGSFLGIKHEFKYLVDDDYLLSCTFFQENLNTRFVCTETLGAEKSSRRFLPKLEFGDDPCGLEGVQEVTVENLAVEEVTDQDVMVQEVTDEDLAVQEVAVQEVVEVQEIAVEKVEEVSVDDSPLEEVSVDDAATEGSSSEWTDSNSSNSDNFGFDEDYFNVKEIVIKDFPVQIIAMERCVETLDSLLPKITPEELTSALFQIVLTLIVYQKAFDFTHNDLHTNNVMFSHTTEPFLYYKLNNKNYKVPTFNKIYKIIDFGRGVYTFQSKRFMSDSFADKGDAATQYNSEPFYDPLKKRIDPNYSFDLCRLACSMVDVLPEDAAFKDLNALVNEWCTDDDGRHVVYKKNGEERYPNFKLYKMIARTVHAHTPAAQLTRPMFQQYEVKKAIKGALNLDDL